MAMFKKPKPKTVKNHMLAMMDPGFKPKAPAPAKANGKKKR